jgi:hypothetical protein
MQFTVTAGGETATVTLGAPQPASGTLFGAAVSFPLANALAAADTRMGPLRMVRVYDGAAGPVAALAAARTAGLGSRPICLSFKADRFGGPVGVVSGLMDAEVNTVLAACPTDRPTYVAYGHEPETKVKSGQYTIPQWVAAFQHVTGLIRAHGNPMIKATMILTGYDYANRLPLYYPGDAAVDVLGVDPYSQNPGDTAQSLLTQYVNAGQQYNKPIALGEIGCHYSDPAQVTAFVQSLTWCRDKFLFVSWFNSPDYGTGFNYAIDGIPTAAAAFRTFT